MQEEIPGPYDGLNPEDVEGDETSDFEETVSILTDHFVPKVNIPFERHLFKQMQQEDGESVMKFIARLRARGKQCSFQDLDDQIRDQVIHTVRSDRLKRKLLEGGQSLTLVKLQEIVTSFEAVENQMAAMNISEVNRLSCNSKFGKNYRPRQVHSSKMCYRCGQSGHFSKDACCPARGKVCKMCREK